jgi:hypothetical protein
MMDFVGGTVETVVARQTRLRQAAEYAQDAIVARDRRQETVRLACLAGATPLPLKATASELDRRKVLVAQALAFVAATQAAGVAPTVENGDTAHDMRVRWVFHRLLQDAAKLDATARVQHYVGAEFRAIEDSARGYVEAVGKAEAARATVSFR